MFKKGDTAYFVFQGDFETGRYKGFLCLPTYNFNYFPFYPVIILTTGNTSTSSYCTNMGPGFSSWYIPADLLEKEFSFDKFILGQLSCDKKISKAQFKMLIATL